MELIITIFLMVLGGYFLLGLLFGLYFVFIGATRIDPLLANSKKGVRLLLLPGTVAVWPLLLVKLFNSKKERL